MTDTKKKQRGFATLTPERRREIASMGGRAAHLSGNAHEYSSDEARAAVAKRRSRWPHTGQLVAAYTGPLHENGKWVDQATARDPKGSAK